MEQYRDREEFTNLIKSGISGRELTALYTGRVDSFIKSILPSIDRTSGLCLMAIGGYGRGELAPFSDIDIMLFARDRSLSEQASRILYKLWDAHLDIGHSFRTPADCITEARRDGRTRTSLLEHRYVAGDLQLHRQFMDTVYPEIAYRNGQAFVSEKLRELEARHKKHGDSPFMLEPNLKEGRGCLRDIHALLWLASVKKRIRSFDELRGILPGDRFRRLAGAYDFLLKTRFCLHFLSGRRNDILSFDLHEPVAEMLGFRGSRRFHASERFMRYLYLKMYVIDDIVTGALDLFVPSAVLAGSLYDPGSGPLFFLRKKITDDFFLAGRSIAGRRNIFKHEPDRMIEAFSVMSKTGRPLSPGLREEIRENVFRLTERTRNSPRAIKWFMKIISGARVYKTLREMHRYGVLGRFLPEFGALSFLVVYEPYHRYTVDEHTLRAIAKLEELGNTKFKSLEQLSALYRQVPHKEVLILSLLLHDIGKRVITREITFPLRGIGRAFHEGQGYRDMKSVVERFSLSVEMRNRVEFLVKNHTIMSRTAFRLDSDDQGVIAQFAGEITDRETLDALYLLTYADMAAVSPDFWSDWKGYMLKGLYDAAARYLEGYAIKGPEHVIGMLPVSDREKSGIRRFLERMPERYAISTPPEKILADYRLSLEVKEKICVVDVCEMWGGAAEVTLSTRDRAGLFSKVVGVLSSMGMNVYSALVYTGKDGMVIDRFRISNWRVLWWDEMTAALERRLIEVLAGDQAGLPLRERGGLSDEGLDTASIPARFTPFVELDNETSQEASIIEFFAQDRIGLLYDAASLFHERGIDIIAARINTESGLAHDIFFVQEQGEKVDGPAAAALLHALWERLR